MSEAKEGKLLGRKKLLDPHLGTTEGTKITSTNFFYISHALTVYSNIQCPRAWGVPPPLQITYEEEQDGAHSSNQINKLENDGELSWKRCQSSAIATLLIFQRMDQFLFCV